MQIILTEEEYNALKFPEGPIDKTAHDLAVGELVRFIQLKCRDDHSQGTKFHSNPSRILLDWLDEFKKAHSKS